MSFAEHQQRWVRLGCCDTPVPIVNDGLVAVVAALLWGGDGGVGEGRYDGVACIGYYGEKWLVEYD